MHQEAAMFWKRKKEPRTHAEVTRQVIDLQTTKKRPAWVGFIPREGSGHYYQYSYLDGRFYLEYMLFPEEQLPGEEGFRSAAHEFGCSVEIVNLNGESYLRVLLGPDAAEAISVGMQIVNQACGITNSTPVEESSRGV
jgi:hypothetical protein